MRWIVYVDMDAFYVACEQREDPSLIGKPVIVGPDPRTGASRGVVLSASYEARATGVRSAMPVGAALRLCPTAEFVRPNFDRYVAASREVRACLRRWSDQVEGHSIDEACVVLERPTIEEIADCARAIQADLRASTRLSASIGVAPNRPVAKIATDAAKPGGVRVVGPDDVVAFLAPLPASVIPGIGPKTAARLATAGVHTVGDLAAAPATKLRSVLGPYGTELRRIARGTYEDPPRTRDGPRSRSVDRTFSEDVDSVETLVVRVEELAGELGRSLAEEGFAYQTVTVALKWNDFERAQRTRSLPLPGNSADGLARLAVPLARDLFHREADYRARRVRMVSVKAERLSPRRPELRGLDSYGTGLEPK